MLSEDKTNAVLDISLTGAFKDLVNLSIKGINFTEITLHVGLGSFNPIMVEDLSIHRMESEEI